MNCFIDRGFKRKMGANETFESGTHGDRDRDRDQLGLGVETSEVGPKDMFSPSLSKRQLRKKSKSWLS